MDVIERIRKWMQKYGWSEYQLAKNAGLSQSTIANIFHRNTIPSIPTLQILCRAFGISLSQFFEEESEDDPPLTMEEKEILDYWKQLNGERKGLVLQLMKELTTHS